MTRAEYEALARRVETEEPSYDLDDAILHAIGQQWTHPLMPKDAIGQPNGPPFFTTSLDAAVTLVPERMGVVLVWSKRGAIVSLSTMPLGEVEEQSWYPQVKAATPAAALTAAALRALAQEAKDE